MPYCMYCYPQLHRFMSFLDFAEFYTGAWNHLGFIADDRQHQVINDLELKSQSRVLLILFPSVSSTLRRSEEGLCTVE